MADGCGGIVFDVIIIAFAVIICKLWLSQPLKRILIVDGFFDLPLSENLHTRSLGRYP